VFFTRRTYDVDAALDLTAETFARAFAARRRFRGSSDAQAGPWLFAIASGQLAAYPRRGYAQRRPPRRKRPAARHMRPHLRRSCTSSGAEAGHFAQLRVPTICRRPTVGCSAVAAAPD
jgi:DNA-directed RNA polymerase specialized sigma24 family protein